jgi:hypothetical protein
MAAQVRLVIKCSELLTVDQLETKKEIQTINFSPFRG